VRARTNTEVWVVNHLSDSVSIVDLQHGRVIETLSTDDEPCDVVFAGSPQRAFVSCSQENTVLVFDPTNLATAPLQVVIDAEDPRAMGVSPAGDKVYVAIFESGNGSTILGGGSTMAGAFPPNVVSDPAGPHAGTNPPPNDGGAFNPTQNGANPAAPAVGLIVKKDGASQWMDDNGGNWTALVSGAQADQSGRPIGWDLPDRDLAVIDATTLVVSYETRLMNMNMALAVRPDGLVSVVGTEGTNEIRFEPVLTGVFLRVNLALVEVGTSQSVLDLNSHLNYLSAAIPQPQRDQSIGDPRGIVWNSTGTRAYVSGMGSNNVLVLDSSGTRAGLQPTIEVGEGPTGVVLHESRNRLYILNKFEATVSVVSLTSELETDRVPFHDASPTAIKLGRKHLYDTHKNSGLGQIACASCHVDARMDRLAWDLGDPAGSMKSVSGQNLAAGIPGLDDSFEDFHPMKGPMLTQTLQDIIGKEPHHWRGDRDGLEEFSAAFLGLQGDDVTLTGGEMQEFEDFLATIHFPPNPFRNFDNSLPTNLPLPGMYTTGRFAAAGNPLPNGDADRGMDLYRPPNLMDVVACVTCHTNPTGLGTDYTLNFLTYVPIAPGSNGERHHALVSVDGSTNVSIKIPQLRNLYERTGFTVGETSNRAGFGYLHDGSIDTLAQFVSEPVFNVTSDQDVADLAALMLAYSGSDLPSGSTTNLLEPPGTLSLDTHAAVGTQVTLSGPDAGLEALIDDLLVLADAGAVGVTVKGRQAQEVRGYEYLGSAQFQADRSAEQTTTAALKAGAAAGGELTFTAVPEGTQTRIGIDRDLDGELDRDEIDFGSDPADAASTSSTSAWRNLNNGLAGLHGEPLLVGRGSMIPGTPVDLVLTGARENTSSVLVVGLSQINAPFSAGIMVPNPDLFVPGLPTGGTGEIVLHGLLPSSLPAAFPLFFQHWILDASGPSGFAASNGLKGTTP
jgi:YVTN family beta-propeller protein